MEQLIKNTEQQYSIPSGLLVAIAKIESGMNAYALNVNGKSVLASNSREASSLIASARKVGISNIDVGIMQLNYRWHASGFASIQEMLNPQRNIEYAASFLLRLKKQHGTWHKALRYYHSAKPEHHKKYSRKVVLCWLNEQSSKF
ncbi:MAG: lytic transglycosylase domain-containing protein [Rickettsiaceae bacterium]|nr:lytic transglycosylase domain-containing protein [Rickettsiaceae bacterium]